MGVGPPADRGSAVCVPGYKVVQAANHKSAIATMPAVTRETTQAVPAV